METCDLQSSKEMCKQMNVWSIQIIIIPNLKGNTILEKYICELVSSIKPDMYVLLDRNMIQRLTQSLMKRVYL